MIYNKKSKNINRH